MTNTTLSQSPQFVQDLYGDGFQQGVILAAERMSRPEYNGRLDKAIDLALNGAVTIEGVGKATVKSGTHTYQLAPDCTCQDSQHHSKYCKHFLAVKLMRAVIKDAQPPANGKVEQAVATVPETQEAPKSSAWGCAQAPSSCTLKWAVAGIELMLTLRDETDDALFGRIQRVLPKIEHRMETQRQEREARQAAKANGSSNGQPPRAKAATTAPAGDAGQWCEYHDAPLKRYTKDGRSWYSHKDDGGNWCRGK